MASCSYKDLFGIPCGEDVHPGHDTLCILHDPSPAKDTALFYTTLHDRIQRQSNDPNVEQIDLSDVHFPPDFRWWQAWDAEVASDISFRNAQFGGEASFIAARFLQTVSFRSSSFTGDANFRTVHCQGDADFSEASFSSAPWVDFTDARFDAMLRFRHTRFLSEEGAVLFQDVILKEPRRVSFAHVDLSRVSFLNTNMAEVYMVDVAWPKTGRRFLFDEVAHFYGHIPRHIPEEDKRESGPFPVERVQAQHRLVAELYRTIRKNLEESKQEVEAGDFYQGQMAMRLLDPETPGYYRLLLRVYRFIALYGESYWRPAFAYLTVAVVSAILYLLGGFTTSDGYLVYHPWQLNIEGLKSIFGFLWGHAPSITFWGDAARAGFIGLTAGALLRAQVQVQAAWLLVVLYANMLLDIFFIALTIVALRRKFRR